MKNLQLLHENLIDAKQAYKEGMKANCIMKLYLAVTHCDDVALQAKIHKVKSLIRSKEFLLAMEMLSDVTREVNIERKRRNLKEEKIC